MNSRKIDKSNPYFLFNNCNIIVLGIPTSYLAGLSELILKIG